MTHVTHQTIPIAQLTCADRAEMLDLMRAYYLGVTSQQFESDLNEKEQVILLRQAGGAIVGFSTLVCLDLLVDGTTVKAVFSGDTIVGRESRTTLGLGVEIARYFARMLEEHPGTELYYILIAKGWQTCRIPALLFREFSPSPGQATVPRHQQVMDAFGARKYPQSYHPETGLIIISGETQRVKPGSSEGSIPPRSDRQVDHFVKKNPNYLRGDELVYVAPITRGNFTSTLLRLLAPARKRSLVG